jgi:hypothetical protein
MLTLHPPSFIETESCDGPRYTRGQPSRETAGVLLGAIDNKYIVEFDLPWRNVDRYTKEIMNNWDRLTPEQKNKIRDMFSSKEEQSSIEFFENSSDEQPDKLDNIIMYLNNNPQQTYMLMDNIMKTTAETRSKTEIKRWNIDNFEMACLNWKFALIVIALIVVIIGLLVRMATWRNHVY